MGMKFTNQTIKKYEDDYQYLKSICKTTSHPFDETDFEDIGYRVKVLFFFSSFIYLFFINYFIYFILIYFILFHLFICY